MTATTTLKGPTSPPLELVQQYDRDGFLVVRDVFSVDELELIAAESERLLARRDLINVRNLRSRWQTHCDSGECRFDAYDPVSDLSTPIAALSRDPRILNLLETLYGEPSHLFKDKLIYKPPGATGYGLHQDYIAWDSFPKSFVTVLVPLDPADADNGLYRGLSRSTHAGRVVFVSGRLL